MAAYTGLHYKTRANADPQGRPRVYFCCHPDDFDRLFEPITKEILDIQLNAAIWYYDPKDGIPDGEDFLADLSQMQLFVIPVTSSFIYKDNSARTNEFVYAVDHHIPVLPLMQESDLEADFNRVCGNLQFLDKYASDKDPTALPYEDKLRQYLKSVLVSDELAQKIRDAFDAYIFLSYRKKDRRYAQQIMRLIHENDFCRDIAIWYDEFLTPGENFNDAIEAAMQKSSLFAMVVTPSLLENPNYVMTVEYPKAKKHGKSILPIEGQETDQAELSELYPGIADTADEAVLPEQLRNSLYSIALRENDTDPRHNFLIGLAYLSGIDVEIDHERALSLITSAAEAGLPEAYEKITAMYENGEGVQRNYSTAIKWQKRYVSYLKARYEERQDTVSAVSVVNSLLSLGNRQMNMGKISDAIESFTDSLSYYKHVEENHLDLLSRCYYKLGNAFESAGQHEKAKQWYTKGLEVSSKLIKTDNSTASRRARMTGYYNLGNLERTDNHLRKANAWYVFGCATAYELYKEKNTVQSRQDLIVGNEKFGIVSYELGELDEAKEHFLTCLDLCRELAKETNTIDSFRNLAVIYLRMGEISEAEKNLKDARTWYQKCMEIDLRIVNEINTMQSWRDLSTAYEKLGDICVLEDNQKEAENWYTKCLGINKKLAEASETIHARRSLFVSYSRLGELREAAGDLEGARSMYIDSLKIAQELEEETGSNLQKEDLVITYYKLGTLKCIPSQEQIEYLKQAKIIIKELYSKTKTERYKLMMNGINDLLPFDVFFATG